jgi:putative ABC transport system permease protein
MIKNYFKTAWRNLLKNKFYSVINIVGLTAGLAIGILILLWVQDELSFDSFHKNAANIYRMELFGGTGTSRQIWPLPVYPMAALAKQNIPEVEDMVRITDAGFSLFKYQDKVFVKQDVVFADPSFFSIFDFPLVKGNQVKPFTNDNSVVITKRAAIRYFGTTDALGKIISADGAQNFTVSGVINDFPENSSMQYDMILPMSLHAKTMLLEHGNDLNNNFDQYNYESYLLLKPGTSLVNLSSKLFRIHISHRSSDTDADYLLLPLSKMHLYNADLTDKGIDTVRIFIIVAILILVIACINYVNLSTARSMLRSKEISMRKIVGAAKIQLFLQFIVETALLFMIAAVLALGLIYILMPAFNHISGKQLSFDITNYHVWVMFGLTIAGTLIASSIYPALLLSSFEPLKALKGKISSSVGDALFRKILVVTQFSFSIILIVGTIVITSQMKYIQSKELGYDKSQTFTFFMRAMGGPHYEAIKAELLKQPGILDVTRSSENIVDMGQIVGDNDWDGKLPGQTFIVHPMSVDKDFIPFFKMKMVAGTNFTPGVNDRSQFILNETAVKQLGMTNPIGKRFRMWIFKGTIVGVVKDFHFASMKEKIAPAVFDYAPDFLGNIYIKTTGRDASKAIAAAAAQFKQYNDQYPFSYTFLDDKFNELYKGEQQQATLFNYFAGIAILISCLGLLGLAAYTAQVRTREIGIRKVLGAGVANVTTMLSMDFLKLVFIAIIVGSPVAWYAMNIWLREFAYRIDIQWWVFLIAGVAAMAIAVITISFQSIKAALANPVKSLRSE